MEVLIEKFYSNKNIQWIDLRSESEYLEDHIPNSISFPILDDAERNEVGILYKDSPEKAKERASIYGKQKLDKLRGLVHEVLITKKQIVFYCYRGGLRSTIPTEIFQKESLQVLKLRGGYKAYRRFIQNRLETLITSKKYVVFHGYTGVGKSEALEVLEQNGYSVLHLERLALNGGSIFGELLYQKKQPTQKLFESAIFNALSSYHQPQVYVEMESRRIGRLVLPKALYHCLLEAENHILMETSIAHRIKRIRTDYLRDKVLSDPLHHKKILEKLTLFKKSLGKEKVHTLIQLFESRQFDSVIEILMAEHYDPLYKKSLESFTNRYQIFSFSKLNDELLPWLESKYRLKL